jgi:hypothetical protein
MATTATEIQALYVAYFNRPADVLGLQFWLDRANEPGRSADTVANEFSNSNEYRDLYASKTSAEIVDAIYVNLFGRHAEAAGLVYWALKLDKGELNIGNVARIISQSAQNEDLVAIDAKVSAAEQFTASLTDAAEILGYSGDAANAVAKNWLAGVKDADTLAAATTEEALQAVSDSAVAAHNGETNVPKTFTLTTSIDTQNSSAGNDIINAALNAGAETFTALDKIDGGLGMDTINVVTLGNLATAAGATVKNVEVANIISSTTITAADVSTWTGLETVNITASGNIAGVVAAATTDINVANGLAGVSVDGGKNVTITNSTAGDVAVGGTTAAAGNVTVTNKFATGAVDIKGAGVLTATANDGAITFVNGTAVNATASEAVALATRVANVDAQTAATNAALAAGANSDTSGKAKLAAAAAVTALGALETAIAAATNVAADQTTLLSIGLATKTALAAGVITLEQKVQIDAAFAAGLVTTPAAARTAAQAIVTPLQTAAASTKAAADSADLLNDANAAAAKTAADAVVAADVAKAGLVDDVDVDATTNTALATATIKGNYGASNLVTDTSATQSTLTSVTLENAAASTLSGLGLTNVSAKGMVDNVTVTNTTVGHTQNFTLEGITAGTYQDANATTVNVVSNGAATNVLTGLSATLATKVNLSGAAGLNFGTTTFAATAEIDASANSGTNTIAIAAGQKYTGGSGKDVVTAGALLQTATVDGGAGTSDQIILTNAANYATTGAAKFLNFENLRLNGVVADISKFTGSTFTGVTLAGSSTISNLSAAQAAAVTIAGGAQTLDVGVKDATVVGNLDTLSITNSTAASILTLTANGVEQINITGSKGITIGSLAGTAAVTGIKFAGSGAVSLTTGGVALNVNTVIDASASTGTVMVTAATSTANGLKIIGSNTKDSTLTSNDLKSTLVAGDGNNSLTGGAGDDSITSGNGNNTVSAGAGNNTITVGNGNNTITSTTGADTITAGNGINVISSGAGNDVITVGTGYNLVTGGAGGDIITFGAHVTGVTDGVVMAAGDSLSAATVGAMATAAATDLTGVDVVTGLHTGDSINLVAMSNTFTGALATTIAGASGTTASIVRGGYDTATHIFTASATGADSMVVYDIDAAGANAVVEAIVLVGYTGAATAAAGIITLG